MDVVEFERGGQSCKFIAGYRGTIEVWSKFSIWI